MKTPAIISVCLFSILAIFFSANQLFISEVENCKVIELQQQQLIQGADGTIKTQIRYLVVTDKGTFVCKNSLLNAKFNNSDLFWKLKKDSVYTFRVSGFGKSFITDYRNILNFK